MVGGDLGAVEKAEKILASLSHRVIHAGPSGFGLRLKLINIYMSMVYYVLTGEVLALAKAIGLDLTITVDLLQNTAAGRGQLRTNYPKKCLKVIPQPIFPFTWALKTYRCLLSWHTNSRTSLHLV